MDQALVDVYWEALKVLANEGNERAKVVLESFQTSRDRGFIQPALDLMEWAYNIHNNTWGETSFAGTVKARVVMMRINKGDQ
jgi:hypothetical protein